jgi:hypothetical protein
MQRFFFIRFPSLLQIVELPIQSVILNSLKNNRDFIICTHVKTADIDMKEDVSLPGGIGGDPSILDTGYLGEVTGCHFPFDLQGRCEPARWDVGKADSERQTATDGACKLNERIARPTTSLSNAC